MKAKFWRFIASNAEAPLVALFVVNLTENELGIFRRWPELHHRQIRLTYPHARTHHSTLIAVSVAPGNRRLLPARLLPAQGQYTPVVADRTLAQDDGRVDLQSFMAQHGILLSINIWHRLAAIYSPRYRRLFGSR